MKNKKKIDYLYKLERKRQYEEELENLAKQAQETEGDHSWYESALKEIKKRYVDKRRKNEKQS